MLHESHWFFLNFSEFICCQTHNVELTEEVKRLKENEEEQQKALRALEQATTKMETEKIKQQAEAVRYRATVTGLLYGVFLLRVVKSNARWSQRPIRTKKYHKGPMRTRSKSQQTVQSSCQCEWPVRDWFQFSIWLVTESVVQVISINQKL